MWNECFVMSDFSSRPFTDCSQSPQMTREQSWRTEGLTLTLLRHITSLGYTVSVHRIPVSLRGQTPAFTEMHAVDLRTDPPVQHMARISIEEGGDTDYRCVCLLAQQVGVDLEDG